MRCIQQYNPEDLDLFAEMITITVVALDENPEQDFLGDIFEELNLHNVRVGQFFTPYSVACLMAAINTLNLKEEIEKKGVISVNDCCCGAGCMLIAFANEVRKSGINYQQHVLFVAQDISMTIALMCYIQLSLLGCAGYVKVGDSLVAPLVENEELTENIWITPMYFCEVWVLRRNLAQIMKLITNGRDECMNEKEKILSEDSVEGDETVEGEVSA
jgi:type I restriction-modification system DNA methylase subunit